ncbi:MAG: NAD(P)H-hydrate dehydratase [Clostridia bacterium]|nr:NAD(P)H-hydrate dehydratase [Clostridia bacterium]
MKLAINAEMKQLDAMAMEDYELNSAVLMENAGVIVATEILTRENAQHVTVIAGTGNNGGDGFVIARHLHNRGVAVKIFVIGNMKDIAGDAMINLNILRKMELPIENIKELNNVVRLEKAIKASDLIVDAVFGTGFDRPLEILHRNVFDIINDNSRFTLSVDIPSGVNGDDGRADEHAIKAHQTITFTIPKCGNILYPGCENNGELLVRSIGIPVNLIEHMKIKRNLITESSVLAVFPWRKAFSHKGDYGKVNLIVGSIGMTGAAILACKSALRSGIGLLKLYIPESLAMQITHSVPEAITIPLQEVRKGVIGITHFERIIEESQAADVVAIGPGCGNTAETSELVRRIVQELDKPVVIDADGINAIARNTDILLEKKSTIVMTPHPGEMSRLIGKTTEEIIDHPVEIAREYAMKWDVVMVLKGARTVVAAPNGDIYVNTTGNSGMATAGSGDVLTGIIAGLIGQGLSPLDASRLGVYVHGRSGDTSAEQKGEYGLLAGDIVEGLIYTMKEMALTHKR